MKRTKADPPAPPGIVRSVLKDAKGGFWAAAAFSGIINLLMLTGPLFMLQVYDRVLASRSVPTLVTLLGFVVALYTMSSIFNFLRARTLSRIAHCVDDRLATPLFKQWMECRADIHSPGYKPVSDLSIVRSFLGSPGFIALFDLPWFPLYLIVVFVLHVQLGLLATFGAFVVSALAFRNEFVTGRGARDSVSLEMAESRYCEEAQRNADSVVAMGMVPATASHWRGLRDKALIATQRISERAEFLSSISRGFRMFLQSAILALGGYLVIRHELSPGSIVASSILSGRALAPIDQFIGGWKQIRRARLAHGRLDDYATRHDAALSGAVLKLPDPAGNLVVENVTKFAPPRTAGERRAILANVSFDLAPGDGLGVIGPSASGKSTLAKLLAGVWLPDQGAVRLDGATFDQWGNENAGRFVGYLPQSFDLISGTIAQNIARFDPHATHEEIVEAARLADVHDMILGFADGYATEADTKFSPLTGGQKQRIALARALFRKPRLVVLDEPNSNLDADGDAALSGAIRALRQSGSVVVVMAHRPGAIAAVDKILMLKGGRSIEFGAKDDVLARVTRAA